MYHQKNRDGTLNQHKYCKKCRGVERRSRIDSRKKAMAALSLKIQREKRILGPLKASDFIRGESIKDMIERLGISAEDLRKAIQ
jgi:hypothetical protein